MAIPADVLRLDRIKAVVRIRHVVLQLSPIGGQFLPIQMFLHIVQYHVTSGDIHASLRRLLIPKQTVYSNQLPK